MTLRSFISGGSGRIAAPLRAAALASVLLASAAALPLSPLAAQEAAQDQQTLNYRDADIRAFINDVSMLTGRMFIVDPRVKGQVTVISNTPVQGNDLFDVFLSTLRVHGYTAVAMPSGAYKILPNEAAVQDATPVGAEGQEGDRFVTEVFKLGYVDGITALNTIKPIVNSEGRVSANRGGNFLVVVDYASNMKRIRNVISKIDRDNSTVEAVTLENTSASEMERIVEQLRRSTSNGDSDSSMVGINAVAVGSSNTLVLKGDRTAVKRAAALVRDLDKTNNAKTDVRVIYLKHADAEQLVPILDQVSNSLDKTSDQADKGKRKNSIAFHKGTNALIINASPELHKAYASVIDQLDVRRAQVHVEAIIVEVSDSAARALGLQYVLTGNSNSDIPFTATNFTNTAPNVLAVTGALVGEQEFDGDDGVLDQLRQAAVNSLLGLSGFSAGFAGQDGDGVIFGVILNALQEDEGSNVLSTPSIMTMDNEEASILVGQEIPITTGEALGTDFANPFRTVDRQNVGIQLDVRPQINEGDTIKLSIRQEVSSILGPVSSSFSDLILRKRELKTTVMVEDGDVVVLGGLIESDRQFFNESVPFISKIPLIGWLFRSRSKSNRKTNLMIFLRPIIVRSGEDSEAVTARKYDLMRQEQVLRGGEATIDYFTTEIVGGRIPQPRKK